MLSTKIRIAVVMVIAALSVAIAAGPASADIKSGPPAAKGCPVEDANGNTYTVAVGTRVGLFYCGSDGEWHFGWLVNGRVAPPQPVITTAGTVPVASLAVARG
jgi:hypothetical protein